MSDLTIDEIRDLSNRLDEPYRAYWSELGHFIHVFSSVEYSLQSLVYHYAGVSEEVGRAAFHGLRIDNAKDVINRLLEGAGNTAAIDRLLDPFSQLSLIASMRNSLTHWGAEDTSDGLRVSNHRLAFTKTRVTSFYVSAETLIDMRADLHKISMHLTYELLIDNPAQPDWLPKFMERALAEPWQYKPPKRLQQPRRRGPRAQRRARQRQQDASPS